MKCLNILNEVGTMLWVVPIRTTKKRAVGVDVVSLARIKRAMEKDILKAVCHQSELADGPFDVRDTARIWAAKEAVVKTLGTGFWQGGIDFPDVVVWPFDSVKLCGAALNVAPNASFELHFSEFDGTVVALALRWEPVEVGL